MNLLPVFGVARLIRRRTQHCYGVDVAIRPVGPPVSSDCPSSHARVAIRGRVGTSIPFKPNKRGELEEARWFVVSQTIGEEFTPPRLPEWEAERLPLILVQYRVLELDSLANGRASRFSFFEGGLLIKVRQRYSRHLREELLILIDDAVPIVMFLHAGLGAVAEGVDE